jgi:hypothetical protein
MSEKETLDEPIREMRDHFFVPPAPNEAFSNLDELIEVIDTRYQAVGETFRHNLNSLLTSVAMPFALASASVHQSHFQRLHTAERIRARSIELEAIQPGEQLEEVREREAYRIAESRMREFRESEDGKNVIILDICDFLNKMLKRDELKLAAENLIQQSVILYWSGFEILFRDMFELELNLNPSKAALLAEGVSTRKRFEVERFPLDVLIKYGFNISDKVGTLLVDQQDFGDLPSIKSVYSVLFPSCPGLTNCLNRPDLWLLYQRRHLFVHRRGTVDQTYLDNTSDVVPLGSTLEVSPKDFEEHFKAVLDAGEALFRCLRKNAMS